MPGTMENFAFWGVLYFNHIHIQTSPFAPLFARKSPKFSHFRRDVSEHPDTLFNRYFYMQTSARDKAKEAPREAERDGEV